jgi:CBS-domain-containing membrane protein
LNKLFSLLGIEKAPVSHTERIVSAIGGFIAILLIIMISQKMLGSNGAAIIITSMGASAVLVFAVPHGPLSQPWPVLGGHLLSAFIGVTCAKFIPNETIAGSLAVGLAIGAMYYLKCIHPPGGATALATVIGGESTHQLGYQFLLTPVLLNVLIILTVAFLFNYLFNWRRYPVLLHRYKSKVQKKEAPQVYSGISHEDFVYALSEIDSFIDISEYDLLRIYDLATKKSQETSFTPETLTMGHFYSNNEFGDDWAVRQLVDESSSENPEQDIVIFKTVAGKNRRKSGYATRTEFLRWAKHQVIRDEDNWKRLDID